MTNVVPLKPKERQRKTRETVLDLLDQYSGNFSTWLDEIANGKTNEQGGILTRPDPLTAAKLYLELLEFGVPKLARTEVAGEGGQALTIIVSPIDKKL